MSAIDVCSFRLADELIQIMLHNFYLYNHDLYQLLRVVLFYHAIHASLRSVRLGGRKNFKVYNAIINVHYCTILPLKGLLHTNVYIMGLLFY